MTPDDPAREVPTAGDATALRDAAHGDAGDEASDDIEGHEGPQGQAGPGGTSGDAATAPRRRRRRRRRRHDATDPPAEPGVAAAPAAVPGSPAAQPAAQRPRPQRHDNRARGDAPRDAANGELARHRRGSEQPARERDERNAGRGRGRSERGRDAHDRNHGAERQRAEPEAPPEQYALLTSTFEGPTTRLDPRRPVTPSDDLELDGPTTPAIPWGKDDEGPAAEVALPADLPADAPADDLDPLTHPLLDLPSAPLGDDIASVAGVRFVPGGRVQWCDAGDAEYRHGDRVMVDSERGARLAWIAVTPARRALRERNLRRVIRRASENDLRGERDGDADRAQALRIAKDRAAALRLPLKVFRVELFGPLGRGARLNIYYTTDERLDLRELIRDVSAAVGGGRVELRQLGVRDEAKAVGGIGSCGLTLCCTTWLPDFVPVSIKMAKDQGLVLSPTKVSGQCGRLKCCLVYEQAAYAELRKGLPKLGKRVIAARGEGRVVEVDVLRQRVRVSYGPGDTEVVPATDVKPLFPSGNQPAAREAEVADLPEAELAGLPDLDDADESDDLDPPASVDGTADPALDADSDDALEPPADDPSSDT